MKKFLLALALFATLWPGRAEADQPALDFDFGSLLFGPPTGNDQQTTLVVDSVGGSDANAGSLQAPRLSMPTALAVNARLGLYRGSSFRSSLPLGALGSAHGTGVQDVTLGVVKTLPVVSAFDPVPGSKLTTDGSGAFVYTWIPTDSAVANDGYANVYVVEINTSMEAAQPVAARRRMTEAANKGIVDSTPGTSYVSSNLGKWSLFLHPSDNLAPGVGSYRYEVVSRVSPSGSWYTGNAFGDGSMSGLQLVGGSGGYGPLCGPTGFAGDRLVVQHATTHSAVLGGGSLSRSVFYEGGDDDAIMLAWYAADPTGLRWSMDRCLFYAGTRPTDMVIAHGGVGGQSYARGDIADCAFIGAGRINGVLSNVGIKYDNVLTGLISGSYVYGVRTVFGAVMPLSAEVRGCVFRQVQICNVGENFHDNLVAAEPAGVANATAIACQFAQAGASATNNLFWTRGLANGFANNDLSNGINVPFERCACARNIFVLDPDGPTAATTYFYHGAADATTLTVDYNLVINLGKYGIYAQGPGGGYRTWADYQTAYPNLDQHSLYVDLSADPRGLKAVFMDPANGDFRWAQTEVASQCAAYCQANHVGPAAVTSRWPLVPTVDAAAAAISLLPPRITSPGAVTFTQGVYGAYQITTDLVGTPDAPITYGTAGLPAWLTVNASSGLVSGVPPQTGNINMTVRATNRAGTGSAALAASVQTAFAAWQNSYFTTTEMNNPAISGPNATPAGDGIPNLVKYALGLNPKIDGTGALPTVSSVLIGTARFLTLTYNKSLAASDVAYTVEVSGDLRAWSSGANATATVNATNNAPGTMQTVLERDLTPTNSTDRRFIRLRMTQP